MSVTSYRLQDRKSFALGTTWGSVARTNLDFNRQQCDSRVVERFHQRPKKTTRLARLALSVRALAARLAAHKVE
jgi:hypothetical protein